MTTETATADSNECRLSDDLSALSVVINGGRRAFAAETLRAFCKCAHCTRARFDGRFTESFPGIAIVGVTDLGYGFNIAFSDGHDRGIYPTNYLATLPSA